MFYIKLSSRSSEKEVSAFLERLHGILESESFNLDRDFTLIRNHKIGNKEHYSTPFTLLDLEYDAEDIVQRLRELTIKEYSETLCDKDDINPPLLFVFGKEISGRLVYIKIKIKEKHAGHVLCVSFHYAEHEMSFPYALRNK